MGAISLDNGKLHYLRWGRGPRLLLAFHGYGFEAGSMHPVARWLEEEYTILSFDLPHHGGSSWGDAPLTRSELAAAVMAIMDQLNVARLSLLGFSMGGRACLTIMELMPDKIDRVLLIAADGLVRDPYYQFATHTLLGSYLFQRVLDRPEHILALAEWLRNRGVISESRYKFVVRYLKGKPAREFMRLAWPAMKLILPHLKKLKNEIRRRQIPVTLVMGINDSVIPLSNARRFAKGLDTVNIVALERGHRVFDDDNGVEIARYLL